MADETCALQIFAFDDLDEAAAKVRWLCPRCARTPESSPCLLRAGCRGGCQGLALSAAPGRRSILEEEGMKERYDNSAVMLGE